MNRAKIYTKLRKEIREYRNEQPEWFRRSLGDWLLQMRSMYTSKFLTLEWRQYDSGEPYFTQLLGMAIMCMEDSGMVGCGCNAQPGYSSLDPIILAVERGCRHQIPGDQKDYAIRIDCYLRNAFEAHASIDGAIALDCVCRIASLAALGIENKPLGEWNGKVDNCKSNENQTIASRKQTDPA